MKIFMTTEKIIVFGIGFTINVLVVGIFFIMYTKNEIILEGVKEGVAPEATLCALSDSMGGNPACIINIMKR